MKKEKSTFIRLMNYLISMLFALVAVAGFAYIYQKAYHLPFFFTLEVVMGGCIVGFLVLYIFEKILDWG